MNLLYLSTKDQVRYELKYPIIQTIIKTYEETAKESYDYWFQMNSYKFLSGTEQDPNIVQEVVTEQFEFFSAIDKFIYTNKIIDELHIFSYGWEHGLKLIKDDVERNTIITANDFASWPNSYENKIKKIVLWANRCGRQIKKDQLCFAEDLSYNLKTIVEASEKDIEPIFVQDKFVFNKLYFKTFKGV